MFELVLRQIVMQSKLHMRLCPTDLKQFSCNKFVCSSMPLFYVLEIRILQVNNGKKHCFRNSVGIYSILVERKLIQDALFAYIPDPGRAGLIIHAIHLELVLCNVSVVLFASWKCILFFLNDKMFFIACLSLQ